MAKKYTQISAKKNKKRSKNRFKGSIIEANTNDSPSVQKKTVISSEPNTFATNNPTEATSLRFNGLNKELSTIGIVSLALIVVLVVTSFIIG